MSARDGGGASAAPPAEELQEEAVRSIWLSFESVRGVAVAAVLPSVSVTHVVAGGDGAGMGVAEAVVVEDAELLPFRAPNIVGATPTAGAGSSVMGVMWPPRGVLNDNDDETARARAASAFFRVACSKSDSDVEPTSTSTTLFNCGTNASTPSVDVNKPWRLVYV